MAALSSSLASALLALSVAPSAAQIWGGSGGSWRQIVPSASGSAGPTTSYWHHATAAAGCFYVSGGSLDGVGNATFQYDLTSNTWTQLPDFPQSFQAPAITAIGGWLLLFGGQGPGAMQYSNLALTIATSNPMAGWTSNATPTTPPPRSGHRLVALGCWAYLMGGWDAVTYYNDLYALDVCSFFANTPTAGGQVATWQQVLPNGAANVPPARNSFSWDAYGARTVVFGGFWHNIPAVGPGTNCEPAAQCTFFSDVWVFAPGNPSSPPSGAAGWSLLRPANGVSPPGRYGHASGIIADQLFVFGGTRLNPAGSAQMFSWSNDMWAFDFASQAWGQVQQSSPWPSVRGWPASAVVGSSLFFFGGDSQSTDLWAWSPPVPGSGGGGGGGGGANANAAPLSATAAGAGLAFASLTSLAALAMTAIIYRRITAGSRQATAASIGSAYEGL